jgi:MFS family permease
VGALVFALSDGLLGLLVGRALLAVGVALALMAGFKAIVLWFPPPHLALANGWLVMLGALGAVTATAPAELVVQAIGWRGLFVVLAALSALAALLILFAVPDHVPHHHQRSADAANCSAVYRDRRFWRLAPLSALGIGASWSLQGLWAAPWLRDVEGLDRVGVVHTLSVMAVAVCASALVLGVAAARLHRLRVKTEFVLAATLMLSMSAQAAMVFGWPLPSFLLWAIIAAAGAATVLSFAILTQYFPKQLSGRANAALNLMHVGCAFLLQSTTGLIIEQWPETRGSYPAEAYQLAMAATLVLQLVALAWFATPPAVAVWTATPSARIAHPLLPRSRRVQHAGWKSAAAASVVLCISLAWTLLTTLGRPAAAVHVLEIDANARFSVSDFTTSLFASPSAIRVRLQP